MATVNITNRFLNENKRYDEAVVVTVPSVLQHGGGRSQVDPIYVQGGDDLVASVIEADSIIPKAYLLVDEAFPAGALVTVTVGGVAYFTDVFGDAIGITVSAVEDGYYADKADVTVVVSGVAGDVMTGLARVVLDTIHPSLNNGQYAN